jgi:hypothetical protein
VETIASEKLEVPIDDAMEKYGQQKTGLSPHRHQSANSAVPITTVVPARHPLRVFSLSPLHKPPSVTDSISSLRTTTPFQTQTPSIIEWRGPTPVWTQYPGK